MFTTIKELIDDYHEGLEIVKQQKLEDGEPINNSMVAPEKIAELKKKPFSFLNPIKTINLIILSLCKQLKKIQTSILRVC